MRLVEIIQLRQLLVLLAQSSELAQMIPCLRRFTIYHLTMPRDHYERTQLIDLYAELAVTARRFCDLTGITTAAFNDLYHKFLIQTTSKLVLLKQRLHSGRLDANILLLLLIWLRKYPGNRRYVGSIDGTRHRINRPQRHQRVYYSGKNKTHCLASIYIISTNRRLIFFKSCFLGSVHDSRMLISCAIGPNQPCSIPPHTKILADKGFANGGILLTPVRRNELRHFPQASKELFNYHLSSKRIFIEHITKEMKVFDIVHVVYKHSHALWQAVSLCTAYLANVRANLFFT
ncbi:unnamed protein product [Didymodactylos carnosus]|uniref:DDE Tnp4 domain-containing protein n=1 Tax=Didymodactylos carnosus TaxID=1234261 RepID=A0A816C4Z5_9BILA|nr:unnamed protein product [Didymodactylos carnosus]CAF4507250.1 unnamed protein product [Didymodactylos carnosus]